MPRSWSWGIRSHLAIKCPTTRHGLACLEATLHRGVDNGGVFGYGAAQALRRALLKLNEKKYEHLVLSILVASVRIHDIGP